MARALVLAHRGVHDRRLENTVRAFEAARLVQAHGVEFDVRALGDGTLVVHHDADLRRGRRRVRLSAVTLADLRRVGPRGRRVPTFDEVLAWAHAWPDFVLNVELKDAHALVPLLRRLSLYDGNVVLTTFSAEAAAEAKRRLPTLRVGWIHRPGRPFRWSRLPRMRVDVVVLHERVAADRVLARVKTLGLVAWVWGAVRARRIQQLVSDPRIAAVITDVPRRAVRVLANLSRRIEGTSPGR